MGANSSVPSPAVRAVKTTSVTKQAKVDFYAKYEPRPYTYVDVYDPKGPRQVQDLVREEHGLPRRKAEINEKWNGQRWVNYEGRPYLQANEVFDALLAMAQKLEPQTSPTVFDMNMEVVWAPINQTAIMDGYAILKHHKLFGSAREPAEDGAHATPQIKGSSVDRWDSTSVASCPRDATIGEGSIRSTESQDTVKPDEASEHESHDSLVKGGKRKRLASLKQALRKDWIEKTGGSQGLGSRAVDPLGNCSSTTVVESQRTSSDSPRGEPLRKKLEDLEKRVAIIECERKLAQLSVTDRAADPKPVRTDIANACEALRQKVEEATRALAEKQSRIEELEAQIASTQDMVIVEAER